MPGNPIWPKRETAETLRQRCPTSVAFLRELADCMSGFCELSRARMAEAADEIEGQQAIVAKLDKTGDGVPVVRGMKVYQRTPAGDIGSYDVGTNSARDDSSCPSPAYLVFALCYSTREAAEAAAEES